MVLGKLPVGEIKNKLQLLQPTSSGIKAITIIFFIALIILLPESIAAVPDIQVNWTVQSGSTNMSSSYVDVPINQVNSTQSFVYFRQRKANSATPNLAKVIAVFRDNQTIRFSRISSGNIVSFEYYVLSASAMNVQSGLVSYNSSENEKNLAINPTNQSQTVVIAESTCSSTNAADSHEAFWTANMTSSTNLKLQREGASGCSGNVSYFAIDFKSWIGVQQGLFNLTGSSQTQAINAVQKNSSILMLSHRCYSQTSDQIDCGVRGNFTNSQTLGFYRQGNVNPLMVQYYVIEIPGSFVQSGTVGPTALISVTASLGTAINSSRSFSYISAENSGTGTRYSRYFWTSILDPAGNQIYLRRDDNTLNNYIAWQAIQFPELNLAPRIINLTNPGNNSIVNLSRLDLNFTAYDEQANMSNCSLWANFSGTWMKNSTLYNVTSLTRRNLTVNIGTGTFIWNIQCYDFTGQSSYYSSNYTFAYRGNPPSFVSSAISSPYITSNFLNLLAGSSVPIYCNGTIQDLDGINSIIKINASLYNIGQSYSSDNDNASKHYSNSSCNLASIGSFTGIFACKFDAAYFSVNGSWVCNVTAYDAYFRNSSNNSFNVDTLLAINVSPVVDYGELRTSQLSQEILATVTNIGNTKTDLNLFGYGTSAGDYNALACTFGNIPVDSERYDFISGTNYADMFQLTGSPIGLTHDINLTPQTSNFLLSSRNVYWKVLIPENVKGQCSGQIVFNAIPS